MSRGRHPEMEETEEKRQAREANINPGLTKIRKIVVRSYEEGTCQWCNRKAEKRADMREHLMEHVVMAEIIIDFHEIERWSIEI